MIQGDSHTVNIPDPACYHWQVTYKYGLNPRQNEAAEHHAGPLLIVAGAGAGKTRTITTRIARLIDQGVPAREILALTFTNKAAGEMRERVRSLGTRDGGAPLVTTFHALCVRLIREFHHEANVSKRFTIWDRDDSTRALKSILEEEGSDASPRSILAALSREKGDAVTGEQYAERAQNFRERLIARAWEKYEKRLTEEEALDFDDLLARTLALLQKDSRVLERLRNRFTHLTIDEYQDTNRVQYEIARLLAAPRNNICVVGDLDQCIYTWRQARLENLLEFERSFPGTKVVTLEQNYRSTRTILAAANSVIEKNARRIPKNLFTENETGEALTLFGARDEQDEAWFVASTCAGLIEEQTSASEIAVLYRENFQSRALEEAFLHLGVPYRVIGTRFFERKEVKDVLSYVRAALNPESRSDITRISGVPPRGIGPSTLEKMFSGEIESLKGAARGKVEQFKRLLHDIGTAAHTLPASETIRFVIEKSGIAAMHEKNVDGGRERLENIRELVNLAVKYDHAKSPEGIENLLEEAALQSEQDEIDQDAAAVSLMTVHASKGLEFDAVFVTGLEQGLFPSMRERPSTSLGAGERDEEEERRLFYVALTRARKRVFLSFASARMRYGSREYAVPSEFLQDIDQRLIQYAAREGTKGYEEKTIF